MWLSFWFLFKNNPKKGYPEKGHRYEQTSQPESKQTGARQGRGNQLALTPTMNRLLPPKHFEHSCRYLFLLYDPSTASSKSPPGGPRRMSNSGKKNGVFLLRALAGVVLKGKPKGNLPF